MTNPSFESWSGATSSPLCWAASTVGHNAGSITRVSPAHTGHYAERLHLSSVRSGVRRISLRKTSRCTITPMRGTVSFWQHSTTRTAVVVAYRTSTGWRPWTVVGHTVRHTSWTRVTLALPAPPRGATAMVLGVQIGTVGTAVVDDVTTHSVVSTPARKPAPSPTPTPTPTPTSGAVLWSDPAATGPALVTNEFAYWNPTLATAVRSPIWEMTSGSLFTTASGARWTGVPDTANPNATSSNGTDSAVFRLTTQRADFQNVSVSFSLHNNSLTSTATTPPVAWDGVHIFLRYQSEYSLYYASVNRRDGHVVLKKKCSGGPSNGGTYYELGPGELSGHAIPFGTDQAVGASAVNNADGSVTLTLSLGGTKVLTATDTGVGCAPITAPGKVGIRGDNDDFTFTGFTVRSA